MTCKSGEGMQEDTCKKRQEEHGEFLWVRQHFARAVPMLDGSIEGPKQKSSSTPQSFLKFPESSAQAWVALWKVLQIVVVLDSIGGEVLRRHQTQDLVKSYKNKESNFMALFQDCVSQSTMPNLLLSCFFLLASKLSPSYDLHGGSRARQE